MYRFLLKEQKVVKTIHTINLEEVNAHFKTDVATLFITDLRRYSQYKPYLDISHYTFVISEYSLGIITFNLTVVGDDLNLNPIKYLGYLKQIDQADRIYNEHKWDCDTLLATRTVKPVVWEILM